jgi:hypothetical protein
MALESVVSTERLAEASLDDNPGVSWGAIFAGAFIALGIQILFTLLGSAIGLTAFDPEAGDTLGKGAGIGAGIYLLVTMIISFFIGGYASSRLAGVKMRTPAMFHGLSAWAIVTVFLTYLVGSGLGSAFRGVISTAGRAGAGITQQSGQISPQTKERILKGDATKQDTANALSQGLGISREGARDIVSSADQKAGQVNPNDVAGKATDVAAGSSWVLFFSLLCSALGAIFGAISGSAGHISVREQKRHARRAA